MKIPNCRFLFGSPFLRLNLQFAFFNFHFAIQDFALEKYRLANSRNVGQFGPVVCPPRCWRKANSPAMSAVSIGGNSVVPRSFLPKSLNTGPAATAAMKL